MKNRLQILFSMKLRPCMEDGIFHDQPRARAISREAADISATAIALRPAHADAHLAMGRGLHSSTSQLNLRRF